MVLESEGTGSRVGLLDTAVLYENEVESSSSGWVLIDFYAEWCGPCKRFSPTLSELSKLYTNIKFYKCDVEVLVDKAEDAQVQAMPTFILFHNGSEVGRVTGADKTKLEILLNKSE
jgi:thioredoxin 1